MKRFISVFLFRKPAVAVFLSFLSAIAIGTVLLLVPGMSRGDVLSPVDAWFTATSSVCVTGLVVVDTGRAFTSLGQTVILTLIQAGGLGIMVLTMSVLLFNKRRLRLREKEILSYVVAEEDRGRLRETLLRILLITLVFEGIGTIILTTFAVVTDSVSTNPLWFGLFHSISAFCNAGFSLQPDSLEQFAGSFTVNMTVATLITTGGLGYGTLIMLSREPGRSTVLIRWIVIGTALLVVTGTYLFYFLEIGNTLIGFPPGEKYLVSFFQSVTLRTAGFNTVSIGDLRPLTILILLPFMFIGASSGGTAGGIKIGTLVVIGAEFKRMTRNRRHATLETRRISRSTVSQAFILLFLGITVIFVAACVLMIFESFTLEEILFEVVSAIGTVGLSTGITASLSIPSKVVISLLMIIGRVGPLTLLSVVSRPGSSRTVDYPLLDIPVG